MLLGNIRTWGNSVEDKQKIAHNQGRNYYHVIRVAKMCGKLAANPNIKSADDLKEKIDNDLIIAHNNEYKMWLTKDKFEDKSIFINTGKPFCQYYLDKWVEIIGKKPIEHIEYRLYGFELLKFNEKFCIVINDNWGNAKEEFEKAVENHCIDDGDEKQTRKQVFLATLRKYGYKV